MNKTTIEWADYTLNPIRFQPFGSQRKTTMCQKVSPGCTNCYAEGIVRRFWPGDADQPFPGFTAKGVASGEFVLDEKMLEQVLRSRSSGRIFWGDMLDMFQEGIPDEFLDKCFAVCALTPRFTHMFLTKRPERMWEYFASRQKSITPWEAAARSLGYTFRFADGAGADHSLCPFPLPNLWLGTSCEDQKRADERIPFLRKTPAAVRFISAEPLLGPLDLTLDGVSWVITGGESGTAARPMMSSWADAIREQCEAAGVAYFHKQNGEWVDAGHEEFGRLPAGPIQHHRSDGSRWPPGAVPSDEDAEVLTVKRVGRQRAGNALYGKVYQAFPISPR